VSADLKVVTMRDHSLREVSAMLRQTAENIDAGQYGEIGTCAMVLFGDKINVFGFGPDASGPTVHIVLCAGAAELQQSLRDHGK
jgi:hypothetical protein